jgi:prepilin-type N-terminal cleavage/methylation domain-containing protein
MKDRSMKDRAMRASFRTNGVRSRPTRRAAGFTLIELMLVILLLGILFSVTVASAVGLTPIYRVRSASRTLAGKIEELRALAISSGKPLGIRYGFLDEPNFYQLIPPAPDEYPDQPIESRRLGIKTELPSGVRFRRLVFPGGRPLDRGAVGVIFSPMGNSGSHVITLEGKKRDGTPILLSVKFNAITGTIDFVEGEAEIGTHED